MLIIGDIHGDIVEYGRIIKKARASIQVGDLGLGFPGQHGDRMTNLFRLMDDKQHEHHKVLRGNHDDPDTFNTLKSYLGNWGYLATQDLFFLSGAWSIDKEWRTPGFDWWPGEQLDVEELRKAVEEFGKTKPRFVVTHDCPMSIYQYMVSPGSIIIPNNTNLALDMMLRLHQPEKWYFGHWHQIKEIFHPDGTLFRCLASHEAYNDQDIPDF